MLNLWIHDIHQKKPFGLEETWNLFSRWNISDVCSRLICHWLILNKHTWKHQETKILSFFIRAILVWRECRRRSAGLPGQTAPLLLGYFSGLSRCKKENFLFSVYELPNDPFKCSQKKNKKTTALSSNISLDYRMSQNQNKKKNPILSPDSGCIQASPTCYLSSWWSKIILVLLKSLDHVILNCRRWASTCTRWCCLIYPELEAH